MKKEIKKEIEKIIDKEFAQTLKDRGNIIKEYDVSGWDYLDVDRMNGEEAYNRGLWRGLKEKLDILDEIRQLMK